jgi:GT2 family glycosyltransferase
MKLRNLLRPRYLGRRFFQRLGPAMRQAGLGRLLDLMSPPPDPYELWMLHHNPREHELSEMRRVISLMREAPVFSICMPVCDPPLAFLREAVESVRAQVYPHWELCIADDGCTDPQVVQYLREAGTQARIRIIHRPQRGGIAAATNDALGLAGGAFAAFLDHDDTLAPHALYRFALVAAAEPECGIIYSDEDKIDENAAHRFDPYFKPDWSPETLLSKMYVGHLLAIRRSLIAQAGGMRSPFDGSQDYDLVLRVSELTDRIVHVPDVLYHWRAHTGSAAAAPDAKPYASDAALAALREALVRRAEPGSVEMVDGRSGRYRVRFARASDEAVTIVIPTRDKPAVLRRCLASIFSRSTYARFEVLLVDNGSVEAATRDLLADWKQREPRRFRVLHDDRPFNYSALNNAAVRASSSPFLVFLNNDTEILSPDWLEAMLEYAQRDSVGAVGGLLLYPDGRVQHAGVVIGIGGLAGHIFKRFPATAGGYYDALKTVTNYSAVTAACMMVRRTAFEAAGGFDETLPVAWNDVDLCLRLREAGFRAVYLPHVRLVHHESVSRGPDTDPVRRARNEREVYRMRERWNVAGSTDPYYNPALTLIREDATIAP